MQRELCFKVLGMDCPSCSRQLNHTVSGMPGIQEAEFNYVSTEGRITYESEKLKEAVVINKITRLGYLIPADSIRLICQEAGQGRDEVNQEELRQIIEELQKICGVEKMEEAEARQRIRLLRVLLEAVFLTIPLIWNIPPVLQLVLATLIQFGPGRYFYRGISQAIWSRRCNMNMLIALSTTIVYLYSAYAVFTQRTEIQLYFLSDGVLISLILFGKYLELLAKGETAASIRGLLHLQPQTVRVEQNGELKIVEIERIKEHDVVVLRAGERIPVDGMILDGTCVVDESLLTGESIPIQKKEGDFVVGGTLNRAGNVRISATGLGKDSVLQQMIDVVQKAQASKAPIQGIADRIASYFIPTVIFLAVIVFGLWYIRLAPGELEKALTTACGVLVVACPCALGLATPTSIMVGTGRAAQLGILFRDGTRIQNTSEVTTVVFDKTGTLTYGELNVTDVHVFDRNTKEEMLVLAASAERYANHPIADAIVRCALGYASNALPLPVQEFEEILGEGIRARVAGAQIICGTRTFLSEQGIAMEELKKMPDLREDGKIEVCIARDGGLQGVIGIADQLRPEAKSTIKELKEMGLDIWLLTGDHQITAEHIGNKLGIDSEQILSEVKPDSKAEKIQELQKCGKVVAMVGDGMNDAPALAFSDVSMAMGSGTDIAMDSAGILLLGGRVTAVPQAIRLSKTILRNVRGNLLWALVYNLVGIPLAACGIMNPAIASAAMSASSIAVLFHALRLKHAEEKNERGSL